MHCRSHNTSGFQNHSFFEVSVSHTLSVTSCRLPSRPVVPFILPQSGSTLYSDAGCHESNALWNPVSGEKDGCQWQGSRCAIAVHDKGDGRCCLAPKILLLFLLGFRLHQESFFSTVLYLLPPSPFFFLLEKMNEC